MNDTQKLKVSHSNEVSNLLFFFALTYSRWHAQASEDFEAPFIAAADEPSLSSAPQPVSDVPPPPPAKRSSSWSLFEAVPEARAARNWALVAVLSHAQRKLLLELRGDDYDPDDDQAADIARRVGLSAYQVRRFYREEHERDLRRQSYQRHKHRKGRADEPLEEPHDGPEHAYAPTNEPVPAFVPAPPPAPAPAPAPAQPKRYKFKPPIVPQMLINAPPPASYHLDVDGPAPRRRPPPAARPPRAPRPAKRPRLIREPEVAPEQHIGAYTLHRLFPPSLLSPLTHILLQIKNRTSTAKTKSCPLASPAWWARCPCAPCGPTTMTCSCCGTTWRTCTRAS